MTYRINFKSAEKLARRHGKTSYVAQLEGRDLIFDLNGRFVKATKK